MLENALGGELIISLIYWNHQATHTRILSCFLIPTSPQNLGNMVMMDFVILYILYLALPSGALKNKVSIFHGKVLKFCAFEIDFSDYNGGFWLPFV